MLCDISCRQGCTPMPTVDSSGTAPEIRPRPHAPLGHYSRRRLVTNLWFVSPRDDDTAGTSESGEMVGRGGGTSRSSHRRPPTAAGRYQELLARAGPAGR